MRGGEGRDWRERGLVKKKMQFCQLSSKLCDEGNFDPLALCLLALAIFPSFSLSQDLPQTEIPLP